MTGVLDLARALLHRVLVAAGAVGSTVALFLVLPLMKTIAKPPAADLSLHALETAELPPPPPVVEEEPEEEEPEEEPEPPELADEAPPLDLAQLELALGPGLSDGWFGGDFAVQLDTLARAAGGGSEVEELFALADLDQKPRALYQPAPVLDAAARKNTPGSVVVVFVVDARGRVESPSVQKSSDPALEGPALAAVRQWKFEPGKRNGEAVRFRMRQPFTFE